MMKLMIKNLKPMVLLLGAALFLASCEQPVNGEGDGGVDLPAAGDDEEDVVENPDPTLMTVANFETTFLSFTAAGGGLEYSIVANPRKKGVNTSRRCGKVVSGGAAWEFIWSEPYGKNFDFTANPPIFKMKVLAPKAGAKVYMKLESSEYPSVASPKEVQNVVTTKEGRWEDLVFDFTSMNPASNRYNKFVILFDAGKASSDEEWYFDEIRVPNDDLTDVCLFQRWEGNPVLRPVEGKNDWMNRHIANAAIIGPELSIDGNWWMYARGGNARNGSNEQIGVFTQSAQTFSPFGPWVPYEGNPVIANGPAGSYDSWRALDSTPVVGKDGITYLYYKARGADGNSHTACAYSSDGLNFTKLPELWLPNSGPTDAVYHELTNAPSPCLTELQEAFGSDVIKQDKLDRKALAAIVFAPDAKDKLELLNRITHKHVIAESAKRIEAAKQRGTRGAILDAPLLFEAGADALCTHTCAMIADREVRKARIMVRDNLSEDAANKRLDAQKPVAFYAEKADFLFENNLQGTDGIDATLALVNALAKELL